MITRRNRQHSFAPAFCAEVMEPRVLLSSATLVKDINTFPATSTLSTLGSIGDWAIFAEDDGVHGVELYRSNATTGGTFLLKDINPGLGGSNPQFVATVGKTMYFSADDGAGRALWRTDGNVSGTIKLAQIEPTGSAAALGKTLILAASDAAHGEELWKSDGTAAGTKLIKDFIPGPAGSDVQDLVTFDGGVYFEADFTANHLENWRTDGSTSGTHVVAGVANPNQSNNSTSFVAASNGIYFIDDIQGASKQHLWLLNGQELRLVSTVSTSNRIRDLTLVGDTLYFTQGNSLWRTNGEFGGLRRVHTFNDGISVIPRQSSSATSDRLYIYESNADLHSTIWGVKGLTVTALKSDSIDPPGQEQEFDFAVRSQIGNDVYFAQALPGEKGEKLWRSDGTTAGTIVLAKFPSNENLQVIDGLTGVGSNVFFISADFLYSGDPYNTEALNAILWKTDGTVADTVKVKSFPNSDTVGLLGFGSIVANKTLYFTVDDNVTGRELWKSDGTSGGTRVLRDIFPSTLGSNPHNLTPGIGGLYFSAIGSTWIRNNANGAISVLTLGDGPSFFGTLNGAEIIASNNALYRSDGTKAGTKMFFSRKVHFSGDQITDVAIAGNTIFFEQAGDLWRSDGTTAGTVKFLSNRTMDRSVALGNQLLFSSFNSTTFKHELWRTDGTAAGTKRAGDLDIHSDFINYKGAVYFAAADGPGGDSLWKSDGTTGGTQKLKSIIHPAGQNPFVIAGDTLYFIADDVTLWKSDGTAGGTKIVKQIPSVASVNNDYFIASAGNRVFFSARDTNHGLELWTSDGTNTGTKLLKDINPGKGDSLVFSIPHEEEDELVTTDTAAAGSTIYFAADDGVHGVELWKSDGTTSGTKLIQDINPGVADSWPQALAVLGNKLFFSAADALHGRELWQLPLT